MLYRITIDLAFPTLDIPNNLFEHLQAIAAKAVPLIMKDGTREQTGITIHKCHHDEDGSPDCELVKFIPMPKP